MTAKFAVLVAFCPGLLLVAAYPGRSKSPSGQESQRTTTGRPITLYLKSSGPSSRQSSVSSGSDHGAAPPRLVRRRPTLSGSGSRSHTPPGDSSLSVGVGFSSHAAVHAHGQHPTDFEALLATNHERWWFEAHLGSDRTTTYKLMPDSGSTDAWVFSDQLKDSIMPLKSLEHPRIPQSDHALLPFDDGTVRPLYTCPVANAIPNLELRSTFHGPGIVAAKVVRETVTINKDEPHPIIVPDLALGCTGMVHLGTKRSLRERFDGILGFAPTEASNFKEWGVHESRQKSFLDKVLDDNNLPKIWTANYHHPDDEARLGRSSITFGKCDGRPRKSAAILPLASPPRILISGVGSPQEKTKIDTGSPYIKLKEKFVKEYYAAIGGFSDVDESKRKLWFWHCNSVNELPQWHLGIQLGDQWVVIDKARMLHTMVPGTKKCLGMLQQVKDDNHLHLYGVPFLQTATTCWDRESGVIRWSVKHFPAGTTQDWSPDDTKHPLHNKVWYPGWKPPHTSPSVVQQQPGLKQGMSYQQSSTGAGPSGTRRQTSNQAAAVGASGASQGSGHAGASGVQSSTGERAHGAQGGQTSSGQPHDNNHSDNDNESARNRGSGNGRTGPCKPCKVTGCC